MKLLNMFLVLMGLLAVAAPVRAQRRYIAGGPMGGTVLPGTNGGMVIGGPMKGVVLPPGSGGEMFFGEPIEEPPIPGIGRGMVVGERPVRPPEPVSNRTTTGTAPTNGLPLALP